MADSEQICPKHGPYPAHLGACPVCSGGGGRPQAPRSLYEEDNLDTDPGAGSQGHYGSAAKEYSPDQDDLPTQIPARRGGKNRILDEDELETDFRRRDRTDETELDIKPTGVEVILWVKEGSRRGKIYKVKDQDIIGSRACEILLDDPKVSKLHAKITCEEGQYFIWDLGSKNGVFVNSQRIRAATALKENDLIKLGDTVFVIKLLE